MPDRPSQRAGYHRRARAQRLIGEAKGLTQDAGTDLDIAYGQLLRRMTGDPDTQYAIIVRDSALAKAERVPPAVRHTLGIELYTVDDQDQVRRVDYSVGH